jgi:hypothetical protein
VQCDDSRNDDDDLGGGDSAEFLVGKFVTIYNNLDNDYHVGHIVDWHRLPPPPPDSSSLKKYAHVYLRTYD